MASENPGELFARINQLLMEQRYNEALPLANKFAELLPHNHFHTTLIFAAINSGLKQFDQAVKLFRDVLETKGCWFSKETLNSAFNSVFKPILASGRLDALLAEWRSRRERDEKEFNNSPIVTRPPQAAQNADFPLFVGLHGLGETTQFFRQHWHTETLDNNYICVYPGSTVLESPGNPSWHDGARAGQDITAALEDRTNMQNVLFRNSVFGGFSQGGKLALQYVISNKTSTSNCLVLCPLIPSLSDEGIAAAAARGVKIFFALGGLDQNNVAAVAAFAARLKTYNIQHQIEVDPRCGHWFPQSWPEITRRAREFFT